MIDVENVPIINNGMLIPTPKTKRRSSPKNLFAIVATIVKTRASPGDRQGDDTVPLASPKRKIDKYDPDPEIDLLLFIKLGI